MQIRENAVRENDNISVEHVEGNINPADIFSKEDKNQTHYTHIRDNLTPLPFDNQINETHRMNENVSSIHPIDLSNSAPKQIITK